MPDLFDIIVTFLDDTKKSPELRAKMREKYGFWSDGLQIIGTDEEAIIAIGKLFQRLRAEEATIGRYGENEGEYSGCYYLEVL